jgi:hypothetical protein
VKGGLRSNIWCSGNVKKSKPHAIDEDPGGKELLALNHLDEATSFFKTDFFCVEISSYVGLV